MRAMSAVDGFRRSVPLVPSRITGVPVRQIERPRIDPGDQRNLERPREDRHVRRRAARRRAQARARCARFSDAVSEGVSSSATRIVSAS